MFRLILASLVLLVALLAVVKAPANFLWRLQVGVTEFPLVFIGIGIIALIVCCTGEKHRFISVTLSTIALLLFLTPVARAYLRAGGLNQDLISYFPGAGGSMEKPFSFLKMFSGIDSEEIVPVSYTYRSDSTREWTYDFYQANANETAPCVIVVHTGSWSSGDNKEFPELNSYLANEGYHVAAIEYRLAPEFKSPSQVDDIRVLIGHLKANAEVMKIDTNNFILLGRSAGGQIALCAAYTLNDPAIKGVISFYAPADMVWGAKISGNKLVLDTDKTFADYLGGPFDDYEEKYYESSAVHHVTSDSPATLIIHGDNDCMVSFIHSQHLDSALTANSVPHWFLDLPGATHACDYNISGPSGQITTFTVERFVASCVGKQL